MPERPDDLLLDHFDRCLKEHGDTALGADWPNEKDRQLRFQVMLDLLGEDASGSVVLCDLGCGTGELLAHLRSSGLTRVRYIGVDRSALALEHARHKFPDAEFVELDVNAPGADLGRIACDYLVANGLFTVKRELTQSQMWDFLASTVERVWPVVRRGIAFNVMSKVVDWERDDLFHVPMDDIARLLHRLAGRRVRLRADYGLYEYTAYAHKTPVVENYPDTTRQPVPVMRPRVAPASALLPYLRRIDATRTYSNWGPLVREFERRLASQLDLPEGGVVSAGSGTSALVGAILAVAGPARDSRPLALVPAFTFAATAIAAERCGYKPHLSDVSAATWMLDPMQLTRQSLLERIGVVIPVAPFGRPVSQLAWREFTERTGIPVVIDAAACFDTVSTDAASYLGQVPVVLSFHATKTLATGEGGCVLTLDTRLAEEVTQALNFGFRAARDSLSPSTNGKLSEYHAAVGLAELDNWPRKRSALGAVSEAYRRGLSAAGLGDRYIGTPDISAAYALFRAVDDSETARILRTFESDRIDHRFWYGRGLHHHRHFAGAARDELPVTEQIGGRLIGLPLAPDLDSGTATRVVEAIVTAVQGRR